LERRHETWWCVRDVPPSLRALLGRKRLAQSLATHSLTQARTRRAYVLARWAAVFESARAGQKREWLVPQAELSGTGSHIVRALNWREDIAKARRADAEANRGAIHDHERMESGTIIAGLAEDEAESMPGAQGEEFLAVAFGAGQPLNHLVERWLAEQTYTVRTEAEHRLALKKLAEWLAAERHPALTDAITRKIAGAFVSALQDRQEIARKTINKHISSLSSYWRWLISKGHVEANPWASQTLSKVPEHRRGQQDSRERAFTDAELATLLRGPVRQDVADMMAMAALTGARREELAQLRVQDVRDGAFHISWSKTRAGVRAVPIHADLAELVARRIEGKEPSAFLLEELQESGADGARGNGVGKAFEYYRRRVGVDDAREGKRRSLVNFHSFRRWFITAAERAGQPPHIIAAVVGHARQGMTLGTYSAGPSGEQHRACVAAVRLPHASPAHSFKDSSRVTLR
jgi:integrase